MTRPRSTETQFPEDRQILHDAVDLFAEVRMFIGATASPEDVKRLREDIDEMQGRFAGEIFRGPTVV